MKQSILLWILAFVITAASAVYQRVTGPTYPFHGKLTLGAMELRYAFERSHSSETNCAVAIEVNDGRIGGYLEWKHHRASEPWIRVPMQNVNGTLSAELPSQPPAGKLDYRVILQRENETAVLPAEAPMVIRFKGDVPTAIIIVHVALMFGGMLLSTRTGMEYFRREPHLKKLTLWTLVFLIAGGFILGPIVQWYAFGQLWTGWPLGHDLTDNKTALAIVAWIVALVALGRAKRPARWALAAAIITFAVFLIPHSVLGSELEYSTSNQQPTISPQ